MLIQQSRKDGTPICASSFCPYLQPSCCYAAAAESVFQQVELAALPEWSDRITRPFSLRDMQGLGRAGKAALAGEN